MIFDRVICGVDPSVESVDAVDQAARLVTGNGRLLLLAVVETEVAVHAGWAASSVLAGLREDAEKALEQAHREIAHLRLAETKLVDGPASVRFLEVIEREKATLVCVGIHHHSRTGGIVLGSTATTILHDAPCAVLVARRAPDPSSFPSRIVVGVDASPQAEKAVAVAESLRRRFGASLSVVAAAGGASAEAAAASAAPGVEVRPGKAVDVLVEAAAHADLVIVGSRGLHGVKALGSVSERVAHQAPCSVLVVR